MPYLILIIGLLTGAISLYLWFLNAKTQSVKTLIRSVVLVIYALILLFFALTGRIIVSIGLLVLAFSFLLSYIREKRSETTEQNTSPDVKILQESDVEIVEEDEKKEKEDE